jgi:hypothetical protein
MSEQIRRFVPEIFQRVWLLYLALGVVVAGAHVLLSGAAQATIYNLVGAHKVPANSGENESYERRPVASPVGE